MGAGYLVFDLAVLYKNWRGTQNIAFNNNIVLFMFWLGYLW